MPDAVDDDDIQAYLDDQLSDQRRAEIATYLESNPQLAAEVELLRRQDDQLRGLGTDILNAPVPQRLTAVLHQAPDIAATVQPIRSAVPAYATWRQRLHFLEAAAAILIFVLGGVVGWFGNTVSQKSPAAEEIALAAASYAYSFYTAQRNLPFEFASDRKGDEIGALVGNVFGRPVIYPDLSDRGYRFVGARILPGAQTRLGLFTFEGQEGGRFSVFFWPSEAAANRTLRSVSREDSVVNFWLDDGLGFAVIGDKANASIADIATAVFNFYGPAANDG